MGGKVLVAMQEHINRCTIGSCRIAWYDAAVARRLVGARLQADIMGSQLLVVARTDSEAAKFIDNNIDPRDQAFILGEWTTPDGSIGVHTFIDAVSYLPRLSSSAESSIGVSVDRSQPVWWQRVTLLAAPSGVLPHKALLLLCQSSS